MKKTTLVIIASLSLISVTNAATLSKIPTKNSLVVYNSNIGLVHEERRLSLNKDDTFIVYKGVASTINSDSVNVKLPEGVTLYSQQYRYDKLTLQKLLDAHIGREIMIKKKIFTLLSHSGAISLVKGADNLIKTVKSKDIVFQTIPKALITKPSLVWNIKSTQNLNTKMEIDYLINNISWKSNYILNISKDKADLSGWISVQNNSGKAFKDTELYLLAGDVNRVAPKRHPRQELRYMKSTMADATSVREKAHEGYHFYTVPFRVNLANREKTEIKFITKDSISISRIYRAYMANPFYLRGEIKTDVNQFVKLQALDIPLPKGVVRTYSKLENTSMLLGETRIKHTPKKVPLKLRLGKNFDIKVMQTVVDRDDNKKYFNVDVEYKVKNSSNTDKVVTLLVPFNRDKSSKVYTKEQYTFTKGNFVTFRVHVKAETAKSFRVNYESKKIL